jgi:cytochrome c-type biogenesis protein CcmH
MIKRRSLLVLLFIAVLGVAPLIAQQQADRVKAIGSKFLCMCGCNQILTQCNHVGCTMSAGMLKDLGKWVDRGDSEVTITQAFVQQYGTTVFAEPPKSGFSLVAWAMPVIYFLIGLSLVVIVITKWRKPALPAEVIAGHTGTKSPGVSQDALERARAQAARETED